ncbi:hypothetical protein GCM10011579_067900 [Streptomyces albiflavescens]|uniref:Uncharacterized protein n=1 Tax=Streptomyces albiflavescens TaxID=1623582 RepID=A0A917YAZ0_9ACTN|nr:hypothetical protein [Streptomyces albiflavescens]GGN81397.1 hypothetical protein GCM10011579_067900 [Streptomyces albiflavescens]
MLRPPPSAHVLWALGDDATRSVLQDCRTIARDKTLAWVEEAVAGCGGGAAVATRPLSWTA